MPSTSGTASRYAARTVRFNFSRTSDQPATGAALTAATTGTDAATFGSSAGSFTSPLAGDVARRAGWAELSGNASPPASTANRASVASTRNLGSACRRTSPSRCSSASITPDSRRAVTWSRRVKAATSRSRHPSINPRTTCRSSAPAPPPARIHAIHLGQRFRSPSRQHVVQQRIKQPRIGDPQQRTRRFQRDRTRSKRHPLAQTPHPNTPCLSDVSQPRNDLLFTVPPEHELLAPTDDRQRNLLRVSRAQDEDDVRGRLLQRLQQSVERRLGEHVRLIDDVDLERPERRGEVHLLAQVADLVDAAVRRSVDLDKVQSRAPRHLRTRLTRVAWFRRRTRPPSAVQRLRQQPCR